jgi:hypothetical protein
MSGELHIYTASFQPATCWTDNCGTEPFTVHWSAYQLLVCRCCYQRHRAENCVVQCFYDGLNIWCAPGKGCQSKALIASKQRREFRNRSRGQKRRWAKRIAA